MAKVRKVLMLIENDIAPEDSRVWAEATTLRDNGFLVSIISPKGLSCCRESYICLESIHLYRYQLPQAGRKYIAYAVEYGLAILVTFWLSLEVLWHHGFDVIHAANPPDMFFLIGLFYRIIGKKFVFDQHDLTPEVFRAKSKNHMKFLYRFLLFMEWCTYKTADLVIVTNASFKKIAIERGHVPANNVFVVRNGPDLERMRLVTPEPELKRGRSYLLVYVGVMAAQDGVEYALYALDNLVHKRRRHDVLLVLMGDGDAAESLHTLAHDLELDSYVHFTGWIDQCDILRYLTVADIGLSPDPQNGLNEYSTMIKTMEYMALGKPVVAFDLAETRFSAQNAALYAIPNRTEDFASKIEALLDDEHLRLTIGAIGRKRIEEELNWSYDKENLLLAYKTLFP